jgi:hypothetical protein
MYSLAERKTDMPNLSPKVIAYLEKLETERRMALDICNEKAEEAKLIKARQEGFQEALELLGLQTTQAGIMLPNSQASKRARRNIPDLILREMLFSGTAMHKSQIAKAIGYLPTHTERALKRLQNSGRVAQTTDGRWEIIAPVAVRLNGHEVMASDTPQKS